MYKAILVGLDGSPRQPAVLKEAAALALAHGATLHLCRAVTIPLHIPPAAWTLEGDRLTAFLVEHANEELGKAGQELGPKLETVVHCRIGQPADVLCGLARELGVGLVIVGTHGYSGIDRLLGTTAAKVVNRSDCSVLVVREPKDNA